MSKIDQECAVCKDGMEAVLEREKTAMESVGWYAHYVPNDPDYPYGTNYHTHGLQHSFDHLNFQVCLSADPNMIHHVLNIAIAKIKEGFKYEHGKKYTELIEAKDGSDYEILMLEAEENDRKVLRMIIPDKDGKFDGDLAAQKEGCRDGEVLYD